ncbi:LysM peptidoglycan-binding domain-containing protein [Bradyrhizobium viridifuturi]|jgi:nucleoid-associated protein YgaU|uniref:LysM peptidoglycan-binding domain-containing protein n=2 Tax=Nitrobacteraceae TaxID=41294 RepID=UPI0003961F72|nr:MULTISPECIES: LysM peptidoglycan-binding domain-containing protein [Bradyrhizobium]ERF82828.1 MAG: fructose-1,6-bisphosphatase II [Bradyrhizobium sp. DFCI-1]OYU62575.1 MAG: peptidoglycan-binding protein [Bradyrhizobium sp. PARBB1]PSO27657.1 LysM peptidoglycan-binding domain-containing protein [Bradyrhizobium sp. MOS004]QRI69343.1 LysM peptidoglycan-binding domain-containing protein [Bradyrhizobium sp. PSBB068]MBR1022326.1 LysM peptidoglycan-binding domain-containing protein [Bradyrhizobium 
MNATAMKLVIALVALAAAGTAVFVFGVRQSQQIPGTGTPLMAAAPSAPGAPARDQRQAALAKVQTDTAALADALAGPTPAPDGNTLPEFDVVNVEPTGETVVAGRALPDATVELLRNGEVYDRAVADKSGQFVMVPRPLPPGNHDLTLRIMRDGKQVTSKQSVAVALEAAARERPMVALMTPDTPVRVLSQPGATASAAGKMAIEAVETEPGGKLHVSGQAAPGATVRLYLNGSPITSATADQTGRLSVTINKGVTPGDYRIRLDEVDPGSGKVRARAEVPFNVPDTTTTASIPASAASSTGAGTVTPQLATAATTASEASSPSTVIVPKITTTTVTRGDSLWRISQRALGTGQRYAVIYRANSQQIRNPNLIYPGQVFVLPTR